MTAILEPTRKGAIAETNGARIAARWKSRPILDISAGNDHALDRSTDVFLLSVSEDEGVAGRETPRHRSRLLTSPTCGSTAVCSPVSRSVISTKTISTVLGPDCRPDQPTCSGSCAKGTI
jgi:hypothetical protein